MITFLTGIAILILGYCIWGKVAEKIFAPDDRLTPALANPDSVERVPLSKKRNMLLQLLNIAGMGPIVGVALGMKFGAIVFLLLPIGNVIGGAIHDYYIGMISARNNGADVPTLMEKFFGRRISGLFLVLATVCLVLVVTTFTNIPAQFIQTLIPLGSWVLTAAVIAIFLYYILSTLYPIDKIIGRMYPFIGGLLILITAAVCIACIPYADLIPDIAMTPEGIAAAFTAHPEGQPLIPMLFITIACGILSGFHATQSPIVSRTMQSEKDGRKIFYGMMIAEGIIAMIWAAVTSILFALEPEMLASSNGNQIISTAVGVVLPAALASLSLIVFIFLAVTSGDTALRVLRTSVADFLKIDQTPAKLRVLVLLPLVLLISGLLIWSNLSPTGYAVLWNYFAWFNQLIASCALLLATAYLASRAKPYLITAVPGTLILFMCISYILWVSPAHLAGAPLGLGLPLEVSYVVAAVLSVILCAAAVLTGRRLGNDPAFSADLPATYVDEF